MHELSITQNILRIATEEAERAGASRIEAIRLRIGALTGISAESVRFYLGALTPGTMAEGVRLDVTEVPVGATCPSCSFFFLVEDLDLECPRCRSMAKVTQGLELSVESLKVQQTV